MLSIADRLARFAPDALIVWALSECLLSILVGRHPEVAHLHAQIQQGAIIATLLMAVINLLARFRPDILERRSSKLPLAALSIMATSLLGMNVFPLILITAASPTG